MQLERCLTLRCSMDTALKNPRGQMGWEQGDRRLSSRKGKEIVQSPIKSKQERLRFRQARVPALHPSGQIFMNLPHH